MKGEYENIINKLKDDLSAELAGNSRDKVMLESFKEEKERIEEKLAGIRVELERA